jgi:drug/metabolite transporter (DMT)-like permease
MLVLATLYWGLSFPLIKSITALTHVLVPEGGNWFLASASFAPRFVIAALLSVAFSWRRVASATAAEIRQAGSLALFASGGTLFQTDGLQFTEASTSAFLTQLSAILIPALLALRYRHSPGLRIWLPSVLVLFGVAILGHLSWHRLRLGRGEWETILCSLFFAGQIITVGQGRYAGNRTGVVTPIMFVFQAALLAVISVGSAPDLKSLLVPWTSFVWVGLTIILALVCTIGAFSLMNLWQPKIAATEAGLVYCIEPVFAAIFALFLPGIFSTLAQIHYPNEHATLALLVGGGLITAANILVLTRKGV